MVISSWWECQMSKNGREICPWFVVYDPMITLRDGCTPSYHPFQRFSTINHPAIVVPPFMATAIQVPINQPRLWVRSRWRFHVLADLAPQGLRHQQAASRHGCVAAVFGPKWTHPAKPEFRRGGVFDVTLRERIRRHTSFRLVGGLEHQFYFPIYWVSNHPNWRSYFSEGWPNHQPVDDCARALCFAVCHVGSQQVWCVLRTARSRRGAPALEPKTATMPRETASLEGRTARTFGPFGDEELAGANLWRCTMVRPRYLQDGSRWQLHIPVNPIKPCC